jgi:hypothetical protein
MNATSAVYRTKAMETLVVNPVHGTVGWRKTGSGELEGLLWSTKTTPAGWITISEYVQQKKDRAEAFRQHCKVNPRALYDKIQRQKEGRWGRHPGVYRECVTLPGEAWAS